MNAFELVSFLGAVYLAAAVILGVCTVASWLDEQARRRDEGV
jgi:hypothetical protein